MYRHACGTVQGTFVLGALVCLVGVHEPACTEWQHVMTPAHCSNICGLFGSFSGRFQRGLWGCQYVRHAIGRFQPDVGYDFGPAGLFERQKRVESGLRGKGVILTAENNTQKLCGAFLSCSDMYRSNRFLVSDRSNFLEKPHTVDSA